MPYDRSVFISATTAGFGWWRKTINEILIAQRVEPLEQTWLGSEGRNVRRAIESRISSATGVICLIGPYYGYPLEPVQDAAPVPRSYTQYEWEVATRWNKPRLIYLIKDEFFQGSDASPGEPMTEAPRLRDSQQLFREEVRANKMFQQRQVGSPKELGVALAMINWTDWPYGGR